MSQVSTAAQLLKSLQLDDLVYGAVGNLQDATVGEDDGIKLWNIPGLGVVGVGAAVATLVALYIAHPEVKEVLGSLLDMIGDTPADENVGKVAEDLGKKGASTDLTAKPPDGEPRVATEQLKLPSPKAEAQTPAPPEAAPDEASVSRGYQVQGSGMPLEKGPLARPSAAIDKVLQNTAKSEGVDYRTLYALAGSESSFSVDADSRKSSATGLFQFTASTWQFLTTKTYPELGYTASDRTDPQKSAVVAARYIKSIKVVLGKKLGREPSIGEAYLGYFMGPTGASNFLDALQRNPNAKGADVFPKAAEANPYIFYHKGDRNKPLTLADTMGRLDGKVTAYYEQASKTIAVAQNESAPPVKGGPQPIPVKVALPAQTTPQPVQVKAPDFTAAKGGAKGDARDQQVAGAPKSDQKSSPAPIATSGTGKKEQAGEVAYVRDKMGRLVTIRS